jgi:hypothetical protein
MEGAPFRRHPVIPAVVPGSTGRHILEVRGSDRPFVRASVALLPEGGMEEGWTPALRPGVTMFNPDR